MSEVYNVRQLTGAIGAEVIGVDLRQLNSASASDLWGKLLKFQAIFIRDQDLTPEALLHVGKSFGQILKPHAGLTEVPEKPEVMLAETRDGEGFGKYNTRWHSDVSFDEVPPSVSIIQAIKLPPQGGDTLFASMYAAYESLSDPIKEMIDGLQALHEGGPAFSWSLLDPASVDGKERLEQMKKEHPGAVHPVVRVHPETNRKALYINRSFTTRILGLSEVESRNLIDLLCEHSEQVAFQMRWQWAEGDIGMWDNRCATHCAVMDYGKAHRVMHRITLQGDRPK